MINEFVSDPGDGEVEWVELYNNTSREINLENWSIEEGSGAKTNLEGVISGIGVDKFFVIEKPKGNLNNKGDIIILRFNEVLIDQVEYGNWGENIENNAPIADDPNSCARKIDGFNSFNNENDFTITNKITKGSSNIIITEDTEYDTEFTENNDYNYSNDIIISEIFPNPFGSDNEDEFIELYNRGEVDVDLTGWKLGDENKRKYEINYENNIIKSLEYFVIYRNESKIALNNNDDSVKLFQPFSDEPLQVVEYEKAVEGFSYNLGDDEKWSWSEILTPGEKNVIEKINHAPLIAFDCPEEIAVGVPFLFDSSDTIDEDGDELEYFWDFGDGITNILPSPEHTFLKEGVYTVKLTVEERGTATFLQKEKIVKVGDVVEVMGASIGVEQKNNIIINEILPNPEGDDNDGEWVEIKNKGEENINLLNWELDDSEGGSSPYKFLSDIWLEPKMIYLIDRADSGIALNNSEDSVRIFNNFNELIDEVEYASVLEGKSYARGENGKLFWTNILTPGEENIISIADDYDDFSIAGLYNEDVVTDSESAITVIASGTVSVEPGILGTQYFYIAGFPSVQIYSYKKDFPDLEVGDYVEVNGEVSFVNGEKRIKTKTAQDIKIVEKKEPPIAIELSCEQVDEEYVGSLISITGEVVERKSSTVYLDDGTDEVVVYIKTATGIDPKNIEEGEILKITGIAGKTSAGIRIMPRSNYDIIKKDVESNNEKIEVLGEVISESQWAISARDKKLELFKYLLVIAGGIIIILFGLLITPVIRRGKNQNKKT
ncbi:MAG: lamin tail domain-containing protein [Candidatus Falkowbacteria bacterium]